VSIVVRFSGTVRAESDDSYGDYYLHAEAIIVGLACLISVRMLRISLF